MDYEKRYKEALKWMQSLYGGLHGATKEEAEKYFPELKESDYEKVKRIIYSIVTKMSFHVHDIFTEEEFQCFDAWCHTWLEKQGEKKPADKVEPKFHEDDWIIATGEVVYQIKVIQDTNVALVETNGDESTFDISVLDDAKLWTIKDAKDGDVLVTTAIRSCPFIYRKTGYNNNLAYYYAGIDGSGDFCEGCIKRTSYHFGPLSNVVPATKEQRDLLFAKMKEAGYEWDADKKELKKIESQTLDPDKVIEWLNNQACLGWIEDVEVDKFVDKFKKDFGL